MDQRQTFANFTELRTLLEQLQQSQHTAHLLVDSEGLERMQGLVSEIETARDGSGDRAIICIKSGECSIVRLHQIIAVNGIFRSDYSEC